MLLGLFQNRVLIAGLTAWFIAQIVKVPIEYLVKHRWNWALWFSTGGMPSSHSALITSTMLATGLYDGFDSPIFALAFAVSMVIVYDAAGVRRQAGFHAQKINMLINEIFTGQPISEETLKEVIGHSPRQVIVGVLLGFSVAILTWLLWH
jgi:uncharacterized protein